MEGGGTRSASTDRTLVLPTEACSEPRGAESERVADHTYRRERHCRGGNDRGEQQAEDRVEHARGDGDAGGVVDKGEEQILPDVAHGRPAALAGACDAGRV